MASVKVRVNLGRYRALRARIANPAGALPQVDRAIREVVAIQFAAGGPGWAKRKQFGTKPAGIAFEGSRLRRAWSTPGAAGTVTKASGKHLQVGVSAQMFPWDQAHQRGARIRAKRYIETATGQRRAAMGMALWHKFGVRLTEAKLKSGIILPARPHARKSKEVVAATRAALVRYFKGRD